MNPSRSLAVIVAATVLAVVAIVCGTILIAVGAVPADKWDVLVSTVVVTTIAVLLGAQQSQARADVRTSTGAIAGQLAEVQHAVNGGLEDRLTSVVERVLIKHRLIPTPPPDPWQTDARSMPTEPIPFPRQAAAGYPHHPAGYPHG